MKMKVFLLNNLEMMVDYGAVVVGVVACPISWDLPGNLISEKVGQNVRFGG